MSPVERFTDLNIKERKEEWKDQKQCDSGLGGYILSAVRCGVHVWEAQLHPWLIVKAAELWGSLR